MCLNVDFGQRPMFIRLRFPKWGTPNPLLTPKSSLPSKLTQQYNIISMHHPNMIASHCHSQTVTLEIIQSQQAGSSTADIWGGRHSLLQYSHIGSYIMDTGIVGHSPSWDHSQGCRLIYQGYGGGGGDGGHAKYCRSRNFSYLLIFANFANG